MLRPPVSSRPARLGVALGLALAAAARPGAASAQSAPPAQPAQPTDVARAREHFDVGSSLYRVGRFVEAAQEFERAYALSTEPLLLHNIYLAYRDAGEIERAAAALRRYLEVATTLSDDDRAVLSRRLAALDQTVARERANAQAAETAARQADEARARAEAEAARIAAEAEARRAADAAAGSSAEGDGGSSGPSAASLALLGTGGGLLLVGGVTGGLALAERGDLETRCAPGCSDDQIATMRTLGLVTDLSLALGGASAAVGLVLLVTGRDDDPDDAPRAFVVPTVGAGRAGLSLVGRF